MVGAITPGIDMLANDLGAVVRRTIERSRRVLIPTFSLGRTQTVIFFWHQLIHQGTIPRLPIFVDSPLAAAATEVFRLLLECFDEETSRLLYSDRDLFSESLVRYTRLRKRGFGDVACSRPGNTGTLE
ncbi:MAG: hypothetical protein EXS16_03205 [Gemmataceae bacterium]|nr:hypothetical protein [Gemmataceae bacterium]